MFAGDVYKLLEGTAEAAGVADVVVPLQGRHADFVAPGDGAQVVAFADFVFDRGRLGWNLGGIDRSR